MLYRTAFLLGLLVASAGQAQRTPDAAPARTMHIKLATDVIKPVPIIRVKGAILIDVQIAGQKVKFLFDNGSDATLIDENFARVHGLALKESGNGVNTGLSTLRTRMTETTLLVGDALTMSGQFLTTDVSGIARATGTPVAGVLGADALRAFVVVINPPQGWIAFGLPRHTEVHAKTKADAPGRPFNIPLAADQTVRATANGQPVSLEVDYGHIGALTLRNDVWERVIPAEARSMQTATATRADGLQVRERVGMVKEVRMGPITLRDVPAYGQPASPRFHSEGLLGLSVLAATVTILDNPRGLLWLFPPNQDVTVSVDEAGTPPASSPH